MSSLYILIPIALVFCALAIKLLLWAINNGQYDDLDKEAWRILPESYGVGHRNAEPLVRPNPNVRKGLMEWDVVRADEGVGYELFEMKAYGGK